MNKLTVLIGEDVGQVNLARMAEAHPEVTFRFCTEVAAFTAAAADADVIFTKRLPPAALQAATRLRWVQAGTAGVNHLMDAGLDGRDILLTNARGAHGVPMAEQILAMMLSFATGLHTLTRAQSGRGRVGPQVIRDKFELEGQTLCVLGLGDIGGTLANKARALGMRVLGVRRSTQPFPHLDQQYPMADLRQALAQADHVALCLPQTPQTQGIVGERELAAMKSTAYIYNVGRGSAIDKEALRHALQGNRIAGAGLDVTDPEPLPADSPLWEMPNVLLGQHTSGSSPYNADRITTIFLDNLDRFLRDEPLCNVINRDLGY